jgi:copper oxidase (laccase) domain-containing protein
MEEKPIKFSAQESAWHVVILPRILSCCFTFKLNIATKPIKSVEQTQMLDMRKKLVDRVILNLGQSKNYLALPKQH